MIELFIGVIVFIAGSYILIKDGQITSKRDAD